MIASLVFEGAPSGVVGDAERDGEVDVPLVEEELDERLVPGVAEATATPLPSVVVLA